MLKRFLIFIGPVTVIILWFLVSLSGAVKPLFLPSPVEVVEKLGDLILSGNIMPHLWGTFYRTIVGFLGAILIGVPLGIILGFWLPVYRCFEAVIDFFRSIPATALFPLFMLWLGIGDVGKIALIMFACSLIVIVHTYYGVKHGIIGKREVAKTMGASQFQILTKIVFWDALPGIFVGARISLSLALVLAVVTEMFIGTEKGLGHIIYDSHQTYRIPAMYAAILLTGILGYLLNKMILLSERWIIHWTGK